MSHDANAGLKKGLGYLKPFHDKYPRLSWADLIQLAGATAIEAAGGPKAGAYNRPRYKPPQLSCCISCYLLKQPR
jgi:catalase (peroxidase I)